jgi:hypothetical protein
VKEVTKRGGKNFHIADNFAGASEIVGWFSQPTSAAANSSQANHLRQYESSKQKRD